MMCEGCRKQPHTAQDCDWPKGDGKNQKASCFCQHRQTERMGDGTLAVVVDGVAVKRDVR